MLRVNPLYASWHRGASVHHRPARRSPPASTTPIAYATTEAPTDYVLDRVLLCLHGRGLTIATAGSGSGPQRTSPLRQLPFSSGRPPVEWASHANRPGDKGLGQTSQTERRPRRDSTDLVPVEHRMLVDHTRPGGPRQHDPDRGHVGLVSDQDRADLERGRERAWRVYLA
jgi:hypothetical protein